MSWWKSLLYFFLAVGVAAFAYYWLLPRLILPDSYRRESEVWSNPDARAAGRELAVLCETARQHPEWFADERSPRAAWLPQSVLRYRPNHLYLRGDGATIAFGGGFRQFGYSMKPAASASGDNAQTTWVFRFFSEDSWDRELGRYVLTAKDALSEAEFADRVFAEYERRVASKKEASAGGNSSASVQRCKFAIQHNQVRKLLSAIRATAQENPDAWCDVLLAFAVDFARTPEQAEERLRTWARARDDFSAWIIAAYGFEKVGALAQAEDAVRIACEYPAQDADALPVNSRAFAYRLCKLLYVAGRYKACAQLCDAVLNFQAGSDHMVAAYSALREGCKVAESQPAPRLEAIETGIDPRFDPFGGIDIDVLRSAEKP